MKQIKIREHPVANHNRSQTWNSAFLASRRRYGDVQYDSDSDEWESFDEYGAFEVTQNAHLVTANQVASSWC